MIATALALATRWMTRAALAAAAALPSFGTALGAMAWSARKQACLNGAPGYTVENLEALGDSVQGWPGRELGTEIQDLEAAEAGPADLYQTTLMGSGAQGAAAPAL